MADISTLDAVSDAVDGPREAEAQPGRNDTNQVDNENGAVAAPGGPPVQLASKPKKKSKSTMARGPTSLNKKCGTGFEDFYADPPMSPAEFVEEKTVIYPRDRPFDERIEECIQRFRSRRRLDSERQYIFTQYLLLGGVDSTQRQFQGVTKMGADAIGEADSSEMRKAEANDVINLGGGDPRFYDPMQPEHWDVDFSGVVSGFLSERLPKMVGSDISLMLRGVDVVKNFLNYVLQHDVCPEYEDNIQEARRVCDVAKLELPAVVQVMLQLPGPFNSAARLLYCKDGEDVSTFGASPAQDLDDPAAKGIFMATIATSDMLTGLVKGADRIFSVQTIEQTFEIKGLDFPADVMREFHAGIKVATTATTSRPCGYVTLVPTTIEDGWDNVCTRAPGVEDVETLFLEVDILRRLCAGMKLRLVLSILNIGLRIIHEVKAVYPSFYVFLPQELMLKYKVPVANERPAPSVEDPEAEEKALQGMIDNDE